MHPDQPTDRSVDAIRARLAAMRGRDLPTHGGRTLAYVYDSGLAEVDALAAETVAAFAGTNGLDPTAFPSLAAMERELVAFAGRLLDAPPGHAGSVTSGGTESCLLAVVAARDARPDVVTPELVLPSTAHAAFHKAAHLFGLRTVTVAGRPRDLPGRSGGHRRRDHRAHRARRRLGAVVRPRRGRPGGRDRRCRSRSRSPLPRRRLHRRVGAAVPRRRPGAPGVVVRGRGRHEHLGRPAQVRLRPQGRFVAAAPLARAAPHPAVRLGRVARVHGGQPDPAVHPPGWTARRGVGHRPGDRERRLPQARADGARGDPRASPPPSTTSRACTWSLVRTRPCSPSGPTTGSTCSPSPTRWPLAGGSCSPSCGSGRWRRRCTCRSARPRRPTSWCATWPRRPRRPARAGPCRSTRRWRPLVAGLDPAALDEQELGGLLAAAGLADGTGMLALPERMAPVNALLDACPPPVRAALVAAVIDLLGRTTVPDDGPVRHR